VTDAWAAQALPSLAPAMHKGDRGRVLVIGGDVGMAGAAMHVARAAFACGAGLVKLALAGPSIQAAQANLPDALTVTTALGPDLEPELVETIGWADAVVLGPGLSRGDARSAFVLAVLKRVRSPVVIDADALHVPGARTAGNAPRVMTPHPGEFAAQFPEIADLARSDRFAAPEQALAYCGRPSARPTPGASPGLEKQAPSTALLLKGVPTVIASSEGTRVVAAGNPALATGGTGDLLAGTIAAWLARGLSPLDAAALGAQVMGRAADLAAAERGARVTRPEDVAAQYPSLWRLWAQPEPPDPPVLLRLDPPAVA
jgi:NAD(P)H-hydrate epimerase